MPTPTKLNQDDSWTEYRRLVLAELERLNLAVAATQNHGNNLQLAMTQAIADTRHNILEKLRDTIATIEQEYDKRSANAHKMEEERIKEIEARQLVVVSGLKGVITTLEDDFKVLDKKFSKIDKEVARLNTKAAMLGALAGLAVAVAGLLVSIFAKK